MTDSALPKKTFRDWLDFHDDRWTFMVLYIGGSVLLSIFATLFWVAMMVVAHFLLEIFRHRAMHPWAALIHSMWHLKLDVALILFALVLSLYGDTIFAALGLGQAARATQAMRGMQVATRFAMLERGIRVFLLTVDDLARVTRAVVRLGTNRKTTVTVQGQYQANDFPEHAKGGVVPSPSPSRHCADSGDDQPWRQPGGGDLFALGFGALCLLLVIGAPVLRGQQAAEIWTEIATQLSP